MPPPVPRRPGYCSTSQAGPTRCRSTSRTGPDRMRSRPRQTPARMLLTAPDRPGLDAVRGNGPAFPCGPGRPGGSGGGSLDGSIPEASLRFRQGYPPFVPPSPGTARRREAPQPPGERPSVSICCLRRRPVPRGLSRTCPTVHFPYARGWMPPTVPAGKAICLPLKRSAGECASGCPAREGSSLIDHPYKKKPLEAALPLSRKGGLREKALRLGHPSLRRLPRKGSPHRRGGWASLTSQAGRH